MRPLRTRLLAALLLPALLAGCMVGFDRNPGDLDRRFAHQIEKVETLAGDPPEKARRVRVWAYDPDEDLLVKVNLPVSLVVMAGEIAVDQAAREASREARRQGGELDLTDLDIDLDALVDSGPGAYVMVNDEDGRVLVWIE